MKKAILYIRVSTDEQAEKGYSLNHQEERLKAYCAMHDIEVVQMFKEDFSAKTFDRPEFNKVLRFLKLKNHGVNLLLFTKWDRFSRNTSDSYKTMGMLSKLGVDQQAIEQPLDLSVPENKLMLAFYLASPEVENDRRALNVIVGMRRGMKEGRWMCSAPKGYKNITLENGDKRIVPSETANIISWAFDEFSKGIYSLDEVRKECVKRGLKCSKQSFSRIMRNPLYQGIIHIPAFKDEPASQVRGLHEAIISTDLFQKVQEILDGRGRKRFYVVSAKDELPLRGFLLCPSCNRNWTGSASTGGSGIKNWYYHCSGGCTVRFKAMDINNSFSEKLKTLSFKEEAKELYQSIVKKVFESSGEEKTKSKARLLEDIQNNKNRLNKAQEMLLDNLLSASEYSDIKKRYESHIRSLEQQILEAGENESQFRTYLLKGTQLLRNINSTYNEADINLKQRIIRSVYKEKMTFLDKEVRTGKLNDVAALISLSSKALRDKNNGTEDKNNPQFHMVPRRRLELPHLAAYAPQAYLYTIPTPGHRILPENNQKRALKLVQRCNFFNV